MASLNTPWVESPFFDEELANRSQLSDEQKEQAAFYHKNGYLLLKGGIDSKLIDAARSDLENNLSSHFQEGDPRCMNLWRHSQHIKSMACNKAILNLLETLYERKPIPFQTLNFSSGSQQKPHSDTIHFNSLPARYMCAAWIALEDMDEENGTVTYYPGSHKLEVLDYSHMSDKLNIPDDLNEQFYVDQYEPTISKLMEVHNIQPEVLKIKKGDVLIWSANLIHGGLPVKDKSRTRWSQVTHYYFENCLYYTPVFSNLITGDYFLRKVENIQTGKMTWGNYNGQKPHRKVASNYRYLISKDAAYGVRDVLFPFKRLYHKLFTRPK